MVGKPRLAAAFALNVVMAASSFVQGCGSAAQTPQARRWSVGFWFWNGSSEAVVSSAKPVDVLFVQIGQIIPPFGGRGEAGPWRTYARLDDKLPSAREYWLVLRLDKRAVPPPEAAPEVAAAVSRLVGEARIRNLHIGGVQLDVDSPTGLLPEYAKFLHEFRKALPPELGLSITALLDWFRGGTAVGDVVREVDEFVPQFYDVGDSRDPVIAAPIDASTWGPI